METRNRFFIDVCMLCKSSMYGHKIWHFSKYPLLHSEERVRYVLKYIIMIMTLMFSVNWTPSLYSQHWTVFTEVTEVFILVPALLGLKGNLEMTLASRLSTAVSFIVKPQTFNVTQNDSFYELIFAKESKKSQSNQVNGRFPPRSSESSVRCNSNPLSSNALWFFSETLMLLLEKEERIHFLAWIRFTWPHLFMIYYLCTWSLLLWVVCLILGQWHYGGIINLT